MRFLKRSCLVLSLPTSILLMAVFGILVAEKSYAQDQLPDGLTYSYDENRRTLTFSYKPATPQPFVDLHYRGFTPGQQNVRMQTVGGQVNGGWGEWTYQISSVAPGSVVSVAITTPASTTVNDGGWPSITVGDDNPVPEVPEASIGEIQVNGAAQRVTVPVNSKFIPDSSRIEGELRMISPSGETKSQNVGINTPDSATFSYADWGLEAGEHSVRIEFHIVERGIFGHPGIPVLPPVVRTETVTVEDEIPEEPEARIEEVQVDEAAQTVTVPVNSEFIPDRSRIEGELRMISPSGETKSQNVGINIPVSATFSYADWGLEAGEHSVRIEFHIVERGIFGRPDSPVLPPVVRTETIVVEDETPEEPEARIRDIQVDEVAQTLTVDVYSGFISDNSRGQIRITLPTGDTKTQDVAINTSVPETFSYADWGLEPGDHSITVEFNITNSSGSLIVSDSKALMISIDSDPLEPGEVNEEYADIFWTPNEQQAERQEFRFAFVLDPVTTPEQILGMEDFYSVVSVQREDTLEGGGNVVIDLNFRSHQGEVSHIEFESNDQNPRYMYERAGTERDDTNQRPIWGTAPNIGMRAHITGTGLIPVWQHQNPDGNCFVGGNYGAPTNLIVGDCFRYQTRSRNISGGTGVDENGYSRALNIKAGVPGLFPPVADALMADITYSGRVVNGQMVTGTVDNYFHRVYEGNEGYDRGYRLDISSKVASNLLTRSELISWLKGKFIFDNEYRTLPQMPGGRLSAPPVDFIELGNNPNPLLQGQATVSCQTCHTAHDLTLSTQNGAAVSLNLMKLGVDQYGSPILEPDALYNNIHASYTEQKGTHVQFKQGFDELVVDEEKGISVRRQSFDIIDDTGNVIFDSQNEDITDDIPLVVHTPRLIGIAYREALSQRFIRENVERALARPNVTATREELIQMVTVPTEQGPEEMESRYFSGINGVAGTLEQGIALALSLEFDRSSSYYPDGSSSQGNVPDEWITLLADYLNGIPAISRDEKLATNNNSINGERLFEEIGCSDCHLSDRYATQRSDAVERLGLPGMLLNNEVRVFTDMLFWDLDFANTLPEVPDSTPIRTRTRSLVDIGWSATTQPCGNYISVLGVCTLEEAIDVHGGEADYARQQYWALSNAEQGDLIAYLESL